MTILLTSKNIMNITEFTIRVYGLLIHDGRILVTDEVHFNARMTKFPGGGLIPGEGTLDCLRRECMEELGVEVQIGKHFYTTDYFQPTQFLAVAKQLISVYYRITVPDPGQIRMGHAEGLLDLRWIKLDDLTEQDVTLPVDKRVVKMLMERREERGDMRYDGDYLMSK